MRILMVEARPGEPRSGNAVTVERWRRILESLGHRVERTPAFEGQRADVMVALHAVRSADSVRRWTDERPDRPCVVALTGTDLYPSLADSGVAMESARRATRLVVLQEHGREVVPPELRERVRVIYQSARPPPRGGEGGDGGGPLPGEPGGEDAFTVAFLCHMREVKDPFLLAEAVRQLPPSSRLRVVHVGAALEEGYAGRARRETETNPRYEWRGEVSREEALALLAGSRLLAVTSRLEGAGNVVSEALACGVPVVASDAGGLVGMLGSGYPGLFPAGDADALADRLERAEGEPGFYRELRRRCGERAALVRPERERASWRALLGELAEVAG